MEYDVYGVVRQIKTKLKLYSDYSYEDCYLEDNDALHVFFLLDMQNIPRYTFYEKDTYESKIRKLKYGKISRNIPTYFQSIDIGHKNILTLDIDRVFRNGDEIYYKGNSYPITYKYNIENRRHELYINYVVEEIEPDKNKINNIKNEVFKIIKEHNSKIDEEIEKLTQEHSQSWLTKLKNKIKGVK